MSGRSYRIYYFIEEGVLVLASSPNNNPHLLEISVLAYFYIGDIK
jgi:hypothetical protein